MNTKESERYPAAEVAEQAPTPRFDGEDSTEAAAKLRVQVGHARQVVADIRKSQVVSRELMQLEFNV